MYFIFNLDCVMSIDYGLSMFYLYLKIYFRLFPFLDFFKNFCINGEEDKDGVQNFK